MSIKKTDHDTYKCNTCGEEFEYRTNAKSHARTSHVTKLTDYDESNNFFKIASLNDAVRNNDYNEKDTTPDKSEQRTLRNHKIRQQNLKNIKR